MPRAGGRLKRDTLERVLERYFQFQEVGGPSPTARWNDSSPSGETPPQWLLRMLEVGRGLTRLRRRSRDEYDAVRLRFCACIARDEEIRYARIANRKKMDCRRRRDDHGAREWARAEQKAQREAERRDTQRKRLERLSEYVDGMARLQVFIDFR